MAITPLFRVIPLILLLFSGSILAHESVGVRAFESDLCTGYREGPSDRPMLWADCCVVHDLAMWAGGTSRARDLADDALFSCVRDKSGSVYEARLIWLGVRIGKLSPVKIPGKQRGNAWGDDVRNTRLNDVEIELLRESLQKDSKLPERAIDQLMMKLNRENRS
jgi:hypothetical protein